MNIFLVSLLILAVIYSWKAFYDYGKTEWRNKYEDLKDIVHTDKQLAFRYKREIEWHNALIGQHKKLKDRHFKALVEKNQLNDCLVGIRYYASLLIVYFKEAHLPDLHDVTRLNQYKHLMKAITDVPDCYEARPDKFPSATGTPPTERAQEQAHGPRTACSCKRCERCWELREKLKKIRHVAANATIHCLNTVILRETECVSSLTKTSPKPGERSCGTKPS